MTKEQENRIVNKVLEAFSILREIDEGSDELYLSISKNSLQSYLIKAHNDAYKKDVAPVLIHRNVDESDLKFKSVDITDGGVFSIEEVMKAYDKATREVIEVSERVGKAWQTELVKMTLQAMRASLYFEVVTEAKG